MIEKTMKEILADRVAEICQGRVSRREAFDAWCTEMCAALVDRTDARTRLTRDYYGNLALGLEAYRPDWDNGDGKPPGAWVHVKHEGDLITLSEFRHNGTHHITTKHPWNVEWTGPLTIDQLDRVTEVITLWVANLGDQEK